MVLALPEDGNRYELFDGELLVYMGGEQLSHDRVARMLPRKRRALRFMGSSPSIALACGVIAVAAACESTLMPPPSTRLAEVRRAAPFGHGNFHGRVFGSNLPQPTPCWRTGGPVPGIRVDLGVWHGDPAYYRDTLTHEIPSTLAEPRFELIDSTTTDAEGRFVFAQLPRRAGFAFRAVPPPGSPWKLVYGISLSGIGDSDTPDHPTLCLSPA